MPGLPELVLVLEQQAQLKQQELAPPLGLLGLGSARPPLGPPLGQLRVAF